MANSVAPTAKIVLYSMELKGVSPRLTCTINDVMVSTATRGSKVNVDTCPAAIVTIIVSPTARDSAKMIDATIPESAAGMTTRVATSNLVEPNA